jgi:ABC-type uncharacterized transport system permease subunit
MGLLQNLFQKQLPPVAPQARTQARRSWVARSEHGLLRLVSLIFSFGSAYAIAQVFAPPVAGDPIRQGVDIGIAVGFGVLGYFLSRSIAYRMMHKEAIWAYLPICLVVEFVEVFCNYVMGVSEVPHEQWLHAIPVGQQSIISNLAYIVLSIIPAVTIFLAVADMDLERRKEGGPKQPSPVTFANNGNRAAGWAGPQNAPRQPQPPRQNVNAAPSQNGANPMPGVN